MDSDEKIMDQITVVTKLSGNSGTIALKKFIALLQPLCKRLCVVSRCPVHLGMQDVETVCVPLEVKRNFLSRFLSWLFTDIRLALYASKRMLRTSAVVIIGTDLVPPTIVAKLFRKKVAIVVIGSATRVSREIYGDLLHGAARYLFSILTTVLSTLNYILAYRMVVFSHSMIASCGLRRYRRKICSNGALFVDTEVFYQKKPLTARANTIGFVGRLEKEKGIRNFVSAIPEVLKETKNVRFVIVGTGELMDEVRKLVGKNSTKVNFVGWLSHQELSTILNEMKLLIVPSFTEGFPAVVLEAMACGVPVLATRVGAIPDIIEDEETGFILKDNSPRSIAQCVINALNHPKLVTVTKKAYALVRDEYSYEAALRRYTNIVTCLK